MAAPPAPPAPPSPEELSQRIIDELFARLVERMQPPPDPLPGAGGYERPGVTLYDATGLPITVSNALPISGASGGGAVTSVDGGIATVGTTTDAAAAADTTSTTLVAFAKRLQQRFTALLAQLPAALVGGRLDVNLGAAPATVTVSGTVTANAGTGTLAISAASLPLPATAATDRTTAAAPSSVELSTGAAFYTAAQTGQFPAALVGNRLDVNLGAAPATLSISNPGSGPYPVAGMAAAGSAISGNPVLTGGSDGANARALLTDASGRLVLVGGAAVGAAALNPITMSGTDSSNNVRIPLMASPGDNQNINRSGGTLATNALMAAANSISAGTTQFDSWRNNLDTTLLASAARTTTQTSADIITYNGHSVIVTLDVTAITSTCSLTVTINYKDPASGKYILLLSGAVVAGVSTNVYKINAELNATAVVANVSAAADLGRILQVVITVGNANSQTYSLGMSLIN